MRRPHYLLVALLLAATLSGCTAFTDTEPTPTQPETLVVAGSGDYPHEIRVSNARDRDVSITIFVEHGDTRYRADHTVAAMTDQVVAGFTVESLPEDSRSVTVRARDVSGNTTSETVSMSDCLGDIVIIVGQDGRLDSTYSIC